MKKLFFLLALFAASACAQTFPVNNLQVNGTSTFAGSSNFSIRPVFAGNTPWDSGNLNPNLYALLTGATFTGPISAPIGSSVPQIDDVRNFGAICGNSAVAFANTTAVQSALSSQNRAYIPPSCSLYVQNIAIHSGQRIYGMGDSSVLVAGGTLTATGLINCTSCTNILVDHLSISTTSAQRTAGVSGVTCSGCSLVRVESNTLTGNYGVLAAGSSFIWVVNNNITAYGENSAGSLSGVGIAIQGTAADTNGFNCGGTASSNAVVQGNWLTTPVIPGAPPGPPGSSPTPSGIVICGASTVTVTGNNLNTPGYFGIAMLGTASVSNTISANVILNSDHESIIVTDGASASTITGNYMKNGAASNDYCLTLDGTQGALVGISVTGNTLVNCHLSAMTIAHQVSQSSIVGNNIVNPNTSNTAAQAGIQIYGTQANFNQIATNTITNNPAAAGYGINETTDGTGFPSHNVYMSNSSSGMTTAAFVIQAGSTSNNNIPFP